MNAIEFKRTKQYKEFYEPRLKAVKKILETEQLKKFLSKDFFQQLVAVDFLESRKVFRGVL